MSNAEPGAAQAVGSGKSIAAIAAGALSTIIIYIINQVTGHPLPAEICAAVQTLVMTAAVWATPHNLGAGS